MFKSAGNNFSVILTILTILFFSCEDPISENPITGDTATEIPTSGDTTTENPITGDTATENPTTGDPKTENPTTAREWTIVVYMAADGNLEKYAIDNFNEMERVNYAGSGVTVLALFDRHEGYDYSNGNWTDTRIYEIQTDTNTNDNLIRSKHLNAPELGLTTTTQRELDTGNYLTLRNTLEFAKTHYSAKNYALMVWGHGTGWRSRTAPTNRAIGFDETTNNSSMSNSELSLALSGMGFSIVSFDTCFGGVLEIAYELKDDVERVIGSPDLIDAKGSDYYNLFTNFIDSPKTIEGFEEAAIQQFKERYANDSYWKNAISSINLSHVEDVKLKLDTFSRNLAVCITSQEESTAVLNILKTATIYGQSPGDSLIDIYNMTEKIKEKINDITTDIAKKYALETAITGLQESLKLCITNSWNQSLGTNPSYTMSVYLVTKPYSGELLYHPEDYVKGSVSRYQTMFVKESDWWGWVPTSYKNRSLLDKLFHQTTW